LGEGNREGGMERAVDGKGMEREERNG